MTLGRQKRGGRVADMPTPRWQSLVARFGPVVTVGVLGIVILIDAEQLCEPIGYSVIGPRVFPTLVGIGLLVAAALLAASPPSRPEDAGRTKWRQLVGSLVALLGFTFLMDLLGMAICAALFLPIQAHLLGSRAPLRDVATGIVARIFLQLVFGQLLSLPIPTGILRPFLEF